MCAGVTAALKSELLGALDQAQQARVEGGDILKIRRFLVHLRLIEHHLRERNIDIILVYGPIHR